MGGKTQKNVKCDTHQLWTAPTWDSRAVECLFVQVLRDWHVLIFYVLKLQVRPMGENEKNINDKMTYDLKKCVQA